MDQTNLPQNLLLVSSPSFDGLRAKLQSIPYIYEEVQWFRTSKGYEVILCMDRSVKNLKLKLNSKKENIIKSLATKTETLK